MALKIIFMGTPNFSVPILDSIYNSKHKIISVYTKSPKKKYRGQKKNYTPIHEYAIKNKIDIRYPEKLDTTEELNFIKELKPDVVVVVAYGKIIPSNFLDIKNIRFINVHASLLPRWRGAAPIQRSIMNLDKETGVSIMKINQKLDTGPFMLQKKIPIKEQDDYESLSNKLSTLGSDLILKSLNLIEKGDSKFIEQDNSKATYAKKIEKKESKIDWRVSAENILAQIRGLSPFPGAWFYHKSSRLKIIKAEKTNMSGKCGEVLTEDLVIACGFESIKIIKIQKEGKKILDINDFLSGYKIKKGEFLI